MNKLGTSISFQMPDGKEITIETGKLAKQADGSVVVRMGNTMLLATVVSAKEAKEDVDFLPLTVDYQEKYASAGKFPGGFFKREARPSEHEILISRLVDRAIRPMLPDDYHADTFLNINLISLGNDDMPDALAGLAASAAISVSDIPFNGPISEARVARIDGEYVVNPGKTDLERADIDMLMAGTLESIIMVEGEMNECSEEEMIKAIEVGHEAIKLQCTKQNELVAMLNVQKREYSHENHDEELKQRIEDFCFDKIQEVARKQNADKLQRADDFKAVKEALLETLSEEEKEEKAFMINQYFGSISKKAIREVALSDKIRLDGRKNNEIRPIWCEIDYLPSAHGSSIFTRGETQSLTTVTLGTKMDEQMVDGATTSGTLDFMLHYNFPPYSTGDARPYRGVGRREVGHGNLALRALKKVLPDSETNPYTVRIVSDILESNGSSSMATVCAGSLALMDAGVKVKAPVSGIAMGLISDGNRYMVLSDILGDEDHLGDMDFKVTGTEQGITACQMDIKLKSLDFNVLKEALHQAREGRLHILNEMNTLIHEPREDYKPHAPRIVKTSIPKEFIGAVIGPGGKVIQEIQKQSKAIITIEEKGDVGIIEIVSSDKAAIDKAMSMIKGITTMPEIGEVYEATVKTIMPYGAFVEFLPGKEGLLHISEIEWKRLEKVEEVLNIGDQVNVKLLDIDEKTGKYKLSRKVLLNKN
ncbi:MAG: polyribonucleotide nucleotidyltransferase [Chitinophagaceae bacterium]|nr:MAG: polyribonucleotide nucleotidyltransferase [Chitinophagaceae bacterium]